MPLLWWVQTAEPPAVGGYIICSHTNSDGEDVSYTHAIPWDSSLSITCDNMFEYNQIIDAYYTYESRAWEDYHAVGPIANLVLAGALGMNFSALLYTQLSVQAPA
ncbi:MAG: hypothetical protein M2R45_00146 [Verrucomicrobia subdivision 3 bacterium]|nr:hypothetical protein [Limisphaerales bacterium]MCS1412394.1 hypothetical protein [Limisphaerales bacterium]